jgi:hypothetical protein
MFELKVKSINLAVRTRAQRRAAIGVVARQLEQIRDAETKCLDNTPISFSFTSSYCLGEMAVGAINEALDSLNGLYSLKSRSSDYLPF